ncbi:flagellar biosynthesis protein FlhB [Liquorilactobacillus capillatus]|uniref:Flagellar biosynthetic protein FlhB n=2 Tax=Liquorilactobacillus capillatus TaxID=480931 RepID=A0A0R1M8L9_9LACO|nr:flagellar biosynthesis protein FlhB [Liquorilactobacillus capillatus]AJA33888.1 flagellar biosynthetic protein FlhB [Liquorilactobacillus capillatus]KRL02100.1 bifunctional flagellar biosynthesis protein FliR FlhB [Liquorilactobacillus capillatus DSM 19910]
MGDKDGKTERPTAKRLKDARKRGEVPKSQELNAALALLAFAVIMVPSWEFVLNHFMPYLIQMIQQIGRFRVEYRDLSKVGIQAVLMIFLLCAPFMALSMAIGYLANLMQVGLLFTAKPLKPDFKKINPWNGLKQMFGLRSIFNMAKTLVKFGVIAYFCYQKFIQTIPILINLSSVGINKILFFVLDFAKDLSLKIAILLLVLSLADYAYQRYTHLKNLRMSKQEIKEEFKQMEGDPQVKSQRKAKYQEMVRNAVANVKKATVLITNPTHFALAIRYDPEKDEVPMLLAKGADQLAQRMKAEARKEHIPMIENRPLAHALYKKVEPGQFVPVEMYESVAEIIALVYRLEEESKNKI